MKVIHHNKWGWSVFHEMSQVSLGSVLTTAQISPFNYLRLATRALIQLDCTSHDPVLV